MTRLEKAAKLVTDARISRGWTQHVLAANAQVGFSTLTRIEQAKPPLATHRIMQKIAMAFEMNYDPASATFVEPKVADPLEQIAKLAARLRLSADDVVSYFSRPSVREMMRQLPIRAGTTITAAQLDSAESGKHRRGKAG